MPTRPVLERFIALVESGAHDRACADYLAEHACLHDNQGPPRVGRERITEDERHLLQRARSVEARCVRPALLDGDQVALRWQFTYRWRDGTATVLESMTWQRWEGDRIVEQTSYYDPAQLTPRPVDTLAT